jgi:hypothetical protein
MVVLGVSRQGASRQRLPLICYSNEVNLMGAMMDCGAMMWGLGIVGVLSVIALVLLIAALVKYLFFSRPEA